MWKCPVCETEYGDVTVCPKCGFDGSCDYERYPTAFTVRNAKSTRALRREWEQKQGPGLDQLLMEWFIGSHQKKDATAAERCFREKAEAAREAGCALLVVERPSRETGLTLEEIQKKLMEEENA